MPLLTTRVPKLQATGQEDRKTQSELCREISLFYLWNDLNWTRLFKVRLKVWR